MYYIDNLKCVLKEEKLSQRQFADLIDIPLRSLEAYLSGEREPKQSFSMKISSHPQFKKYTLWLMTGTTAPESGQVCPAFSINQDTHEKSDSIHKKA
ncbi:helix-turn-helix domain-containing protein [Shewanella sp. D64]|uniref:helix-turn-helix domain-containing protein n=1 Tax=unclassified Shewanella TaxID=196818 RepID=UPI0022BA6B81|nr:MULTISPECIES: helix-turn-helix transcriptional regulator [unclassified Shewanella]MEC4728148.1 helix-turn-helix domain-containing protein [Shewanella sp. D64]MEC4740268.1 helix-turn-helix domain-containing protein [Shewanella sp. E94]WBJ94415.1 helix-turn-helix domain-containing protein [Shewanella sp. MTB7]